MKHSSRYEPTKEKVKIDPLDQSNKIANKMVSWNHQFESPIPRR